MNVENENVAKSQCFKHSAIPDVRDEYMKMAKILYDSDQEQESIFYQAKILNMGFVSSNENVNSSLLFSEPLNFKEALRKNPSNFRTFALQFGKRRYEESCAYKNTQNENQDFQTFNDIKELCKSLPSEWTVLQLCKDHDKFTTTSYKDQILERAQSIYVSILKHARSSEFPDPICFKIEAPVTKMKNLYSNFADISKNYKNYIIFSGNQSNKKDLANYKKSCKALEDKINVVLNDFKSFIGPFAALFAGNVIKAEGSKQKALFKEVDEFCNQFKTISQKNRVLLSLISRQADKLSLEYIKTAAKLLSDGDSKIEKKIEAFLKKTQLSKLDFNFNSCILIIDEFLDHMFWESICLNQFQEVCRISSLFTLSKLYKKYKSLIKNGYVVLNIKNGNGVVNPDNNLPQNEKRMKLFFDYWMPSWNILYNTRPTQEQLEEFYKSDCYIYTGHGHGLHLLSGKKVAELQINAVVFLFGCDSVRLTSTGHHAEMSGSHLYYHNALCPAVIGSLVIGLDYSMDLISCNIVSSWVPSKQKLHWSQVDYRSWKMGNIQEDPIMGISACPDFERRLATIVAKARKPYDNEKNYNTVGIVYRGLPVYNSSRAKM